MSTFDSEKATRVREMHSDADSRPLGNIEEEISLREVKTPFDLLDNIKIVYKNNPRTFDLKTIEQVARLILEKAMDSANIQPQPYQRFETLPQWILYLMINPQKDSQTLEALKDAFHQWAIEKTEGKLKIVKHLESMLFQKSNQYDVGKIREQVRAGVAKTTQRGADRAAVMRPLFPEYKSYENRGHVQTLEDWKKRFERFKDMIPYMTYKEIINEKDLGLGAEFSAYRRMARRAATINGHLDRKTYISLMQEVYPPFGKKKQVYEFEGEEVAFDSVPERVIGIILYEYGLITEFKEGVNLHVRTREGTLDSIDFAGDNFLIEFHPVSQSEIRNQMDLHDVWADKSEKIEKDKLINKPLYFISNLRSAFFYKALIDIRDHTSIPVNEKLQHITPQQLQIDIQEAFKKANEYDKRQQEEVPFSAKEEEQLV